MSKKLTEQELLQVMRDRMGINELNALQQTVLAAARESGDLVVYAPTGSGKTLAFGLPLVMAMKPSAQCVQAVVIAPTRELVLQIQEVLRTLAVGLKVTCCYGGHDVRTERLSLAATPDIVVSTPGRLLDHIGRGHVNVATVRLLALDEFDKALELGFDDTMRQVLRHMPGLSRRFLTSATVIGAMPNYVRLNRPRLLNLLDTAQSPSQRMTIHCVNSQHPDKLEALCALLLRLRDGKVMVFVNYRDAVERVQHFLLERHITAGAYHGALDQNDREMMLAMFENGSLPVLVTTDLGARGLDIDGVEHVVHYHLPLKEEEFIHRNGRTARVSASGDVYVVIGPTESLPSFVTPDDDIDLAQPPLRTQVAPACTTLYFQAGKKEKISRGDILGFIVANSEVVPAQVGRITIKDHYALVAVPCEMVAAALPHLQAARLKGRRVRISVKTLP